MATFCISVRVASVLSAMATALSACACEAAAAEFIRWASRDGIEFDSQVVLMCFLVFSYAVSYVVSGVFPYVVFLCFSCVCSYVLSYVFSYVCSHVCP